LLNLLIAYYLFSVLSLTERLESNITQQTTISVEDATAKIASLVHLINPELLQQVALKYLPEKV
jgi:hypothetical protein